MISNAGVGWSESIRKWHCVHHERERRNSREVYSLKVEDERTIHHDTSCAALPLATSEDVVVVPLHHRLHDGEPAIHEEGDGLLLQMHRGRDPPHHK